MANKVDKKEVTEKHKHRLYKYLREEVLPTAFCPGCGCGIVLNCFAHAVDELQESGKRRPLQRRSWGRQDRAANRLHPPRPVAEVTPENAPSALARTSSTD